MLAFSGRELPDGPFRAYTPRTITDRESLAWSSSSYVRAIRAGRRRARAGLTAIAAPIRAARGELEAIVALAGPGERFGEAAVETRRSRSSSTAPDDLARRLATALDATSVRRAHERHRPTSSD